MQRTSNDPVVLGALRLFQAEPGRSWTVNELAKRLGVSRPVLGRRFRAELGLPPLRSLTLVRMQRVRALLRGTNDSLATIARRVGYESEFALSRAFRRHVGVPPSVFRRTSQLEFVGTEAEFVGADRAANDVVAALLGTVSTAEVGAFAEVGASPEVGATRASATSFDTPVFVEVLGGGVRGGGVPSGDLLSGDLPTMRAA